jgi:acylphosphatase
MPSLAWVVSGRVQGVWFRGWTREQALALGLSGRALNRPDGTVYVDATGPTRQLVAFAQVLTQGPRSAAVASVVEVVLAEPPYEGGFYTG